VLEKLKQRWNIESNTQIVIVFLVFTITGFSILFAKKLIYSVIGVSPDWAWYFRLLIWPVTILPTYYVLLLLYGSIFGQQKFFFWFAKKSFGRFKRKKKEEQLKIEAD